MTKNIDYENTVFEHADLTKITGVPTYESLKVIKDKCAANASLLDSTLGGGAHGLAGLVFPATEYALLSPIPFVRPVAPGPLVLPVGPGVTNFQRELARDAHKESVCVFNEASQEDFIRSSDDLGWLENLLAAWSLRTYAENCHGSASRN